MPLRLLSLCLLLGAAQAAEHGVLLTHADLRAKPSSDAPIRAQLAAQSPVTIVQRQGSWALVQNNNQQGWLKVFQLGTANHDTSMADATVQQADNLSHLTANPEAVQKLDRYRANRQQAQQLAQQRRLTSHKLDYLKAD
jgi:hypothetical protein